MDSTGVAERYFGRESDYELMGMAGMKRTKAVATRGATQKSQARPETGARQTLIRGGAGSALECHAVVHWTPVIRYTHIHTHIQTH